MCGNKKFYLFAHAHKTPSMITLIYINKTYSLLLYSTVYICRKKMINYCLLFCNLSQTHTQHVHSILNAAINIFSKLIDQTIKKKLLHFHCLCLSKWKLGLQCKLLHCIMFILHTFHNFLIVFFHSTKWIIVMYDFLYDDKLATYIQLCNYSHTHTFARSFAGRMNESKKSWEINESEMSFLSPWPQNDLPKKCH